jgi:hypothetical protein
MHPNRSQPGIPMIPATYREREILVYERTGIITGSRGTWRCTIATGDVILAASPHRLH